MHVLQGPTQTLMPPLRAPPRVHWWSSPSGKAKNEGGKVQNHNIHTELCCSLKISELLSSWNLIGLSLKARKNHLVTQEIFVEHLLVISPPPQLSLQDMYPLEQKLSFRIDLVLYNAF